MKKIVLLLLLLMLCACNKTENTVLPESSKDETVEIQSTDITEEYSPEEYRIINGVDYSFVIPLSWEPNDIGEGTVLFLFDGGFMAPFDHTGSQETLEEKAETYDYSTIEGYKVLEEYQEDMKLDNHDCLHKHQKVEHEENTDYYDWYVIDKDDGSVTLVFCGINKDISETIEKVLKSFRCERYE